MVSGKEVEDLIIGAVIGGVVDELTEIPFDYVGGRDNPFYAKPFWLLPAVDDLANLGGTFVVWYYTKDTMALGALLYNVGRTIHTVFRNAYLYLVRGIIE